MSVVHVSRDDYSSKWVEPQANFYITFRDTSIFRGYHLIVRAPSVGIVQRYLEASWLPWDAVYTQPPTESKPFREEAEQL